MKFRLARMVISLISLLLLSGCLGGTTTSPDQGIFTDNLVINQGGFIDIPLHNTVSGDSVSLSSSPAPINGTLTLAADTLSVRYQSNGVGVGQEQFTFIIKRQLQRVEEHNVALMTRRNDTRPNILFVLTDDQNIGLEQALPWTASNIRDMGIDFKNSFVPLSVCCPSRASILTGKYPHNHHVLSNTTLGWGGAPQFKAKGNDQQTIAVWLQEAGYATALFGKYMNQYPEYAPRQISAYNSPSLIPPGWTEWYGAIDIVPDDAEYSQYGYGLIENGIEVRYGEQPDDYFGDVITSKAENFIKKSIAEQIPFFAYVSYVSPHLPSTPAPRHIGKFQDVQYVFPPSYNEADVTDKPLWVQMNSLLPANAMDTYNDIFIKQLESLLSVDEGIQKLFSVLQDTGELSRTYVIFTSDNGYRLGQHRLPHGKTTSYEEDIRVPLWVRGPGIPEGKVNNDLVVNIDLAPTFNELADIAPQPSVDGRSLLPLLFSDTAPTDWRRRFLVQFYFPYGVPTTVRAATGQNNYFAVRDMTQIFVQYTYGDQEYYNLTLDPYQLTNTVSTTDLAVTQDLYSRLQALKVCVAESCRSEESRP